MSLLKTVKVKDLLSIKDPGAAKEIAEYKEVLKELAEAEKLKMTDLLEMSILEFMELTTNKAKEATKVLEEFIMLQKVKP